MEAISLPPSQIWNGNNGPWSSFTLQVGDPAQDINVLPATSKSNVWAVSPELCQYQLPGAGDCADCCATYRGGLYNDSDTAPGKDIHGDSPFFKLPFIPEEPLGYEGNATAVRLDVVGLGGQVLRGQAITAFVDSVPWLAVGLLGLADYALNVTSTADAYRSPLTTLRDIGRIPSLFWGYNAGARYKPTPVYASLTMGGYDAGRGGNLKKALKVPMRTNNFRDLVVSVQAVSIGGGELSPVGSEAFIDSVVPELWLPESVCKVFEDALNLQWNQTAQMYLLDEDRAQQLLGDTGPGISFTVAEPGVPSNSIEISLPYAAFVLEAKWPLAGIQDDSVLYYFPLKHANYTSEVYLGHTFLQEAYLAADYGRSEFYLSQADLSEDAKSNIKTVYPQGHQALGTGAIAGIAVGVVVLFLLAACVAAWYFCRPRWRKRRNSRFRARIEAQNAGFPDTQLPTAQETEMQEYYAKRPLSPDSDYRQELDAATTARGSIASRAEMESPGQSAGTTPRGKMSPRRQSYGFPQSPAELESRSPRMMHSRTASGSSVEPMSPLSGRGRTELETTEELHEMP